MNNPGMSTLNAKTKKISVVIAAYQDALAIPIMYQRLVKIFKIIPAEYEIIFVNDGSPDESESIIKQLVDEDAQVIGVNHARNFSSQMAFTSGLDIATGDAVVLMDGDLQDPPELLIEFYRQWQAGYDVVYGVRVKREAPLLMAIAYKLFYRLFQKLSYIRIPLDAGDFSLLDRKVVAALKRMPEKDRFVRGLRSWVGFRQVGVPYIRPERMFGVTTNSLLKNFQWATKGIFSFSYAPLQFLTLLSLVVCFLSVIGIILQILLRLLIPTTPHGITTIIVVVLFIGSIQMLGLSILGEYLGKVLEEVKGRPHYIIKSIIRKS
jgi:polyisoprenyl-phosphate glycosyltransferase